MTTSMPSKPVFTARRRVEFADTDLAGIVHFANFFRYMENAEHAFYRALGFSVHPDSLLRPGSLEESAAAAVAWPRVSASCDFKKPLRFEQEVEIEIRILALKAKTIEYEYRLLIAGEEEPAAIGRMTVICVRFDRSEGRMRAVDIPEAIRAKIETSMEAQC